MQWLNNGEITLKVISNEQNPALTSGDMMTVDMGISQNAEDQLMVLNVLTNTLYTDKIAAVLREYGCNAYDANVEAGREQVPIEVRLPNKLEPTLAIRDFGFGMTQEQILTVFCKLGRSTKRSSNEFTGMLGIGSKAGFAYGDQFNVTSWTNGTRVVYSCYRDKGMPKLAKLDEKNNTGEKDGVEVKLPIKRADIDQFSVTAERVFRYFKVPPKITGAKIEFRRTKPSQQGTGWRFIGDGKSYAIMGNVGYDVNPSSLGDKLQGKARILLELGVELDFQIGDLEIAANREGLQYKDVTNKSLAIKLAKVLKEASTLFSNQIASAKTLWEAKKLYYELFETRGGYAQRNLRDAVNDQVTWKGKLINSGRYNLKDFDPFQPLNQGKNKGILGVVMLTNPSKWSYGRRNRRETKWFDWFANENYRIIINDLPTKKNSPTREAGFWRDFPNVERALLLAFETDKDKDTWWAKWELDGSPVTLLSSIVPLQKVAARTYGVSAHASKHQASAFVLKEGNISGIDSQVASTYWDTATVDTKAGKGAYVELERFEIQHPAPTRTDTPSSFIDLIYSLRKAGLLKKYTKIYGFKKAWLAKNKTKLGAGWEDLPTIITAEIKAFFVGKEQDYANFLESKNHNEYLSAKDWDAVPKGNSLREYIDSLTELKQGSFAQVYELLSPARYGSGHHAHWLGKAPTATKKPTVSLDKLKQKALEDFPMLKLWGTVSYYKKDLMGATAEEIKLAIDYVNMVLSQ